MLPRRLISRLDIKGSKEGMNRQIFSTVVGGELPLSPKEARAWLDGSDGEKKHEGAIEDACRWFGGEADRTLWLRYGRSAFGMALDLLGAFQGGFRNAPIALPPYMCKEVIFKAQSRSPSPIFYGLCENLAPKTNDFMDTARQASAVLTCAYFGAKSLDERLTDIGPRLRKLPNEPWIIEDRAMAFPEQVDISNGAKRCDFMFFTLRKSYPVPDGAPLVACSDRALEAMSRWRTTARETEDGDSARCVREKVLAKVRRHDWLNSGHLVDDPAANGLRESIASEAFINDLNADKSTDTLFGSAASAAYFMSRDKATDRRTVHARAQTIVERLRGEPSVKVPLKDCTGIAVPIMLQDRDKFVKDARSQGIFLPVHWAKENDIPDKTETRRWYEEEVGIPTLATSSPGDIDFTIERLRARK
jgi:hypothetical protein